MLYLSKSALEFPDTALEVIAKETVHLARNAFEIIAHGLNLHRDDITSSSDINAVIASCNEVMEEDISDYYQRKVKPLYSTIMAFSTHAEKDMDPEQLERLMHLRRANWQIVTAIKHMKELHKNVDRYMCSENTDISQEYNTIRLNLAILLRALFMSSEQESPARRIEQIRAFRERMEDEDIIANGTLDRLIREQRITPDMATSLMNDSAFSYDIQNNLINAAEIVFANLYSTEKDMELTEVDADLEQAGDEPPKTDTGVSG